jgi:hypothetical protein
MCAGGVGSVGLLANVRSLLWIPISQDAEKRISLQAFQHMLNLDLSFHLGRKTGAPVATCCAPRLLQVSRSAAPVFQPVCSDHERVQICQ